MMYFTTLKLIDTKIGNTYNCSLFRKVSMPIFRVCVAVSASEFEKLCNLHKISMRYWINGSCLYF